MSMHTVQVRVATQLDAGKLAALEDQCFAAPWSEAQIQAELAHEGAVALLSYIGQAIVGYALFRKVLDEAELLRIGVDAESRRRGNAAVLLHAGFARLAQIGVRQVFLEVHVANVPARALYDVFGFQETGRRSGYYPDGGDAVLYARKLPVPGGLP